MAIQDVLKSERILLDLEAINKEEVLSKLASLLEKTGALSNKEAFLKDVMEREAVSSTGVGNGIAIPHGKSRSVRETTVAIGRLIGGNVEWETFDGKPIELIILLAVREDDKNSDHVRLLSQMARKLAKEETCKRLTDAETKEEIIQIFSEEN